MDEQPYAFGDILSLESDLEFRSSSDGPWVKVFGRIADYKINFYPNKDSEDPIKTIHIRSAVTADPDPSESHAFNIMEAGQYHAGCKTKTSEETHRWIEIIRALTIPPKKLTMENFNIISVIGRGFFGKVMLVQQKEGKELFAIKTVQKTKLMDSGKPQTIVAERNILMLVKNPFIVQLHFAFQTPQKFYLGLEYAPGGELFYHMEQSGLIPLDDARLYTAEIAIALAHLHKLGIVYRDLKPENILFDGQGHIKLTDFGLAKDLLSTPTTSTFCGTNHYLAPEIVKGDNYSYEIDWWALGVLLCEMLTGVTPFDGETRMQIFTSIVEEEPQIPLGVDDDARELIAWLLTKDPKLRPDFDLLSAHRFFSCLDWEYVYDKRYIPTYVPEIPDLVAKPQNFDPEFTNEAAIDSQCIQIPTDDALNVDGFSFSSPQLPVDQNGEIVLDSSLIKEFENFDTSDI